MTTKPKIAILVTGGGTGGHVFPALSIALELRSRGYAVTYVGSPRGMENRLVPPTGIPFIRVNSGGVKNQGLLKTLRALFVVASSVITCTRLIRQQRPKAVVGVGGYVSVPCCLAAFALRVPIYLQEQNASVGIANRFLGRLARRIFLGFEPARRYFPEAKCEVTGNPLREEFLARKIPPIEPDRRSLLVLGGSQGARAINQAIALSLKRLTEEFPDVAILHQTGANDLDATRAAYEKHPPKRWQVVAFIENMLDAYADASLIVCRAGALTVAELLQVGRPAILVPYPRRGQNDQTANARVLEHEGLARVVEQGEMFQERLWSELQATFQPDQLRSMAGRAAALRRPRALASICDRIQGDIGPA